LLYLVACFNRKKEEDMKRILNAEQMRRADRHAMDMGIPSLVLMERAALAVADEVESLCADRKRVCVVCGTGNNGGDGLAAARILCERGWQPDVRIAGSPEKYSEQMRTQAEIAGHYPLRYVSAVESGKYEVVVDALFGIGLHRPVEGDFAKAVEEINRSEATVVAVDIPSGVHTDTGQILGTAVRADLTVTFAAGKTGLYLYPGASCAGKVVVREIGIPVEEPEAEEPYRLFGLERGDLAMLPERDPAGNKGTFKKLLVIAGSSSMCGAAYLSARAALLCGPGMVKIFTAEENRTALSVLLPEALLSTYTESSWKEEQLCAALDWADGAVIGPGIGTSGMADRILRCFLDHNRLPAVLDADALNLMSAAPELWDLVRFPCVITPHIGEMSRLTGRTAASLKADPVAAASAFARERRVTCILKDARSVTALQDGRCWLNLSGNSALATAGSGDVLSGIAGVLTTQYPDMEIPAAAAAAYIHGLCGEAAAARLSERAATARDVLDSLPEFL
jgi:hydroxyethylthiazole kinase-like uncharacterized protein yjeF